MARLLARTLPRVAAIEIEGVGHMGPITHPDRVNALIQRDLDAGAAVAPAPHDAGSGLTFTHVGM